MKKLNELTEIEHTILKSSGMLFCVYPQATGNFEIDCKSEDDDFSKVEEIDIFK